MLNQAQPRRVPAPVTAQVPGHDVISSFNAIVPMACVTAAGAGGAGRRGVPRSGERMPIAGSASSASSARRSRRGCCGIATPSASASSRPTTSGCSSPRSCRRRPPVAGDFRPDDRARAAAARRVLRAAAVRDRRHDADGDGDRPAGHLPRARGAVARGLRPHRHPARLAALDRGGAQVLPARRVRQRFFLYGIAFIYGVTGSTRLDRIGSLMAAQSMCADADAAARRRAAAGRLRLQGLGGAVPHVDAGRLRGRADGGHRRSCRPA